MVYKYLDCSVCAELLDNLILMFKVFRHAETYSHDNGISRHFTQNKIKTTRNHSDKGISLSRLILLLQSFICGISLLIFIYIIIYLYKNIV